MKKLWLLLLLLPITAFAQNSQQQIYCNASTQTPCNTSSNAGNGTQGDPAWLLGGKANANFNKLFTQYARTSAEIAAGVTPVNYGYAPGNVLRYGCVGNNSTLNDSCISNAIASATAAGGTRFVYFPSGIYKHASTIAIPNGITIYGDGMWGSGLGGSPIGSALVYTGTSDQMASSNPINSSTAANISIHDITLDSATATAGKANYDDVGSTFLYFDHISFTGAAINLILDQSEIVRVKNCLFQNVLTTGIWIVNGAEHTVGASPGYTNELLFLGDQFNSASTTTGIALVADDGGTSHKFIANNFNHGGIQIRANAVSGLEVLGNEMESPGTSILDFETTKYGGAAGSASLQVSVTSDSLSVGATATEINIASAAISQVTITGNTSSSGGGAVVSGLTNATSYILFANAIAAGGAWPGATLASSSGNLITPPLTIASGVAITTTGVTCAMVAGTSCTATVPTGSVHCAAYAQGATAFYAACGISGTTATVTANASNSATWLVTATQ